jgi:hypothetical protein
MDLDSRPNPHHDDPRVRATYQRIREAVEAGQRAAAYHAEIIADAQNDLRDLLRELKWPSPNA